MDDAALQKGLVLLAQNRVQKTVVLGSALIAPAFRRLRARVRQCLRRVACLQKMVRECSEHDRYTVYYSTSEHPNLIQGPEEQGIASRGEMDEVLTVAEQLAREQDKVDAFICEVGEETFAILVLLLECILAHRWMPSLPRLGRKHLPRAMSGR